MFTFFKIILMIFRILVTFCLLISFINTSAQEEEPQCVKIKNFSVEERNQDYPFNKARRVVFASFKENHRKLLKNKGRVYEKGEIISYVEGKIMQEYFDSLRVDFTRYNPDDFEEKVDLNDDQKNELTDLIFNFGTKKKNLTVGGAKCYMPRNAILFFNENDELFGFLEICFQCNGFRKSNKEIDLYDRCGEKLYLLKEQFAKAGIKYGIEKEF